MSILDLFKRKKEQTPEKINLDDDLYLDDEMKTFNPEDDDEDFDTEQTTIVPNSKDDVIHLGTNQESEPEQNQVKVDFSPENYNEIQKAAWMFQHAKRVVISVEKMAKDDRSKTLNFFAGMVYALDGEVQHLAKNIFIFRIENKN